MPSLSFRIRSLRGVGAAVGLIAITAVTITARSDLDMLEFAIASLIIEATTCHLTADALVAFSAVHDLPPPFGRFPS